MLHRLLPANPTLADRFGFFFYWLFKVMAQDWQRRGLRHVHDREIGERIAGLWKRLRSVLDRYRAGTLRESRERISPRPTGSSPVAKPHSPQGGEGEGEGDSNGWSAWQKVLPRTFGWVKSLLLPESQYCVTAFHSLLHEDAEMQAVIAAAPGQVGRVLRPFCHFLGLELPAALRLPKRVRVRAAHPSPHPSPSRGEGEDTSPRPSPHSGEGANGAGRAKRRRTPREVAADAIRESERTGKPIDPKKIGAVAFGYTLHWPRDGNCPPPEIGYGGRRRKPPKDYKPPPKDWE